MIKPLESVQIKIEDPYLLEIGGLPIRGSAGSAGYDLRACIKEEITLYSDNVVKIPTGFSIHIEDPNWSLWFLPRSGLGFQGLIMANGTGLIDADYTGPTVAACWNRDPSKPIKISPGDRIAQMVFVPVGHPAFEEVTKFDKETARGSGGFGSTGK